VPYLATGRRLLVLLAHLLAPPPAAPPANWLSWGLPLLLADKCSRTSTDINSISGCFFFIFASRMLSLTTYYSLLTHYFTHLKNLLTLLIVVKKVAPKAKPIPINLFQTCLPGKEKYTIPIWTSHPGSSSWKLW
jgi:hypothetical protein